MDVFMFLYAVLLFFVFTPAILFRLPSTGNKYTVTLVHAFLFALVWELTHKMVWKMTMGLPTMMMGTTPEPTPTKKVTPTLHMPMTLG